MTFNKLLARFKPNQANTSPIVVIMQSDGVFLSEKGQQEVSNCDVRANNWQKSLAQQLSSYPQKGRQVQVIIGSHWYHTYQIETPRIPKSEWPQALPFLLKDVISERVTDIVADGLELPSLNKTTAYVVQKAWLLQLRSIVEESGHELSQVVPEELVWAQGKQDAESYVLLQRSRFHHYRVSAFSQGLPLFHRTIRTVSGPVIQGDNLGLDVDSLALELQRSLDYLSSQLKTGAVHKLLCCCDEESEQQLSLALSERLSVNVVPLVEQREGWAGELLARIAVQAQTFAINLYPEYLKPKQEHLSLNRVAALWGVTMVCLLMASGYSSYVMKQKVAVIEQLELQSESLHQQLSEKQAALEAHRPSPVKAAAIARLKQEIEAKQDALKAVDDYDQKQQLGYSGVMNALATLGRNDISIQNIYLDQDNIDLSGLARSASAVPNWVGQFKQEQSLVGRTFKTLKIGRNANDIVMFELRTRPELASLKSLVNNGEKVTASQVKEARQ